MRLFDDSLIPLFNRRWRHAIVGAVLGGIIGYGVSFLLPSLYEAKTAFYPVNLENHPERSMAEQALEAFRSPDLYAEVADSLDLAAHYGFGADSVRTLERLRRRVDVYRGRYSDIYINVRDRSPAMARRISALLLRGYERKMQRIHRDYWLPIFRHWSGRVDSLETAIQRNAQRLQSALRLGHVALNGPEAEAEFEVMAERTWDLLVRRTYYEAAAAAFHRRGRRPPDSIALRKAAYQALWESYQRTLDSILGAHPSVSALYTYHRALLTAYEEAVIKQENAREQSTRRYSYANLIHPTWVSPDPVYPPRRLAAFIGMIIGVLVAGFFPYRTSRPSV